MMFATNPEMWHKIYGHNEMQEGGALIRFPSTEEEFEEMLQEWEGANFHPLG